MLHFSLPSSLVIFGCIFDFSSIFSIDRLQARTVILAEAIWHGPRPYASSLSSQHSATSGRTPEFLLRQARPTVSSFSQVVHDFWEQRWRVGAQKHGAWQRSGFPRAPTQSLSSAVLRMIALEAAVLLVSCFEIFDSISSFSKCFGCTDLLSHGCVPST